MSFTDEFRRDSGIVYPPFCKMYFEKYFYTYMQTLYSENKITQELYESYIPVFWTELQITDGFDNIKGNLQTAIDNLPTDKLYFTVVQHDDGIMIRIPNNVIVFGMGGIGNIPLPLTYDNTDLFEIHKNNPKTVFCSFVGSLTHQCRVIMVSAMNKPDVVIITDNWTFQIKEDKQQLFLDITSKSRFTLAPRGYGKTSFRMYEALRLNSIPVYIYDDAWLPYIDALDWSKLAVLVHIDNIDTLYNRLKGISDEQITEMLDYYHSVEHYFTYDGMCEYVLDKSKIIFCTK